MAGADLLPVLWRTRCWPASIPRTSTLAASWRCRRLRPAVAGSMRGRVRQRNRTGWHWSWALGQPMRRPPATCRTPGWGDRSQRAARCGAGRAGRSLRRWCHRCAVPRDALAPCPTVEQVWPHLCGPAVAPVFAADFCNRRFCDRTWVVVSGSFWTHVLRLLSSTEPAPS
jgi:hypothetical protein